jgi:hypothetical protein
LPKHYFDNQQVYASGCDIFCQTNILYYGKDGNANKVFSPKIWDAILKRMGFDKNTLVVGKHLSISLDSILGISDCAVRIIHSKHCGFSVADSYTKLMTLEDLNKFRLYDTILLAKDSKGCHQLLIPDSLIVDGCYGYGINNELADKDNMPHTLSVIFLLLFTSVLF